MHDKLSLCFCMLEYLKEENMYYILFIILIAIILFGISNKLEITHTTIYSDTIKSDVTIAIVGDLHSCYYGENMEELVIPLLNENVDIILNVGDMYDGRVTPSNSTKYFKQISNYNSFYTSGNHELHRRKDIKIKKEIRKLKTVVLEGEYRRVNIKNTTINICGVDDIQIGNDFDKQLKKALKGKDENFTILMSHRPHTIDIFKNSNVDLVVSGHAHGGQWLIPFINRGVFAPNQMFFAKYVNGLYKLNEKTNLFVTRGLARESVKIPRIYNKPEISILYLKERNKGD